MPKYLVSGGYTAEGIQGLQRDKATGRRQALERAIGDLKGELETLYYCFGDDDVVIIADLPDNVSVAALSLAAASTGLVRVKTTPLLTVEEVDKALSMTTSYRPPGAG